MGSSTVYQRLRLGDVVKRITGAVSSAEGRAACSCCASKIPINSATLAGLTRGRGDVVVRVPTSSLSCTSKGVLRAGFCCCVSLEVALTDLARPRGPEGLAFWTLRIPVDPRRERRTGVVLSPVSRFEDRTSKVAPGRGDRDSVADDCARVGSATRT